MRGPNIKPQTLIRSTLSLFKGLPSEINNFNSKSSLETTRRGHMCRPRRWIKSCVACQDRFRGVPIRSSNGDGLDPIGLRVQGMITAKKMKRKLVSRVEV